MKNKILPVVVTLFYTNVFAQTWTQKTDFPEANMNGRWSPYAFIINDKIYAGGGYVGNFASRRDLWEYDTGTDTWIQKQNVPGSINRTAAIAFSINGKGYVGLGIQNYNTINTIFLKDLREYDPATDTWTPKANLPDSGRAHATCFVVNGKAYVAGGLTGYPETASNDLWMYDPVTDQWTSLQSFPADFIYSAMSFSAGTNGYVVGGRILNSSASSSFTSKFTYQYDVLANSWNQKADYCDTSGRENGIAFVLNNHAYVGTGMAAVGSLTYYYREFCVYDILTDTWTQALNFPATDRSYAVAAMVNNKVYAGAGFLFNTAQIYFNDWWEFSEPAGINELNDKPSLSLFPNPAYESIFIVTGEKKLQYDIIDSHGNKIISGIYSSGKAINISRLPAGVYALRFYSDKFSEAKFFIKSQ